MEEPGGRGLHSSALLCLSWGLTEFVLSQQPAQYLGQRGAPAFHLRCTSHFPRVVRPAPACPTLIGFRETRAPRQERGRQGRLKKRIARLVLSMKIPLARLFSFQLGPMRREVERSQRRPRRQLCSTRSTPTISLFLPMETRQGGWGGGA